MLSKSPAKQLVYRQRQLMCDPESWSDSAALGKNKQGQTSGGSAVHPDAPLRQQWMEIK